MKNRLISMECDNLTFYRLSLTYKRVPTLNKTVEFWRYRGFSCLVIGDTIFFSDSQWNGFDANVVL